MLGAEPSVGFPVPPRALWCFLGPSGELLGHPGAPVGFLGLSEASWALLRTSRGLLETLQNIGFSVILEINLQPGLLMCPVFYKVLVVQIF